MDMHKNKTKTGLAAILAVLFVAPADAQEDGYVLEEIVTTARRIEENLQDVPVSVAAFTGDALDRRQIFSTDALDQVTPNLHFTSNAPISGNSSASQIFIRGIGQTDPTAGVDPGVGLYIDDVYQSQSVGGVLNFLDIASVQVLRGPQGTLFGRNTIGGAILITTIQPGDEFAGTVRAGFGTDSLFEVFGVVDLPISDTLKSRFSVGSRKRDGYVTQLATGADLGDDDSLTATAKFVFIPSDEFSASFKFDYVTEDENGSPLVFAAYNESAVFGRVVSVNAGCPGVTFPATPSVPLIDDPRCVNDFWAAGKFANNGTVPLESSLDKLSFSLILNWQLSDTLALKSISAYQDIDWRGIRDADNTPFRLLHTDIDSDGEQFSQEFQLLYRSARTTGVFGVYYQEEEVADIFTVELTIPPKEQTVSNNNFIENDNFSVFTQWTFGVTDALSATLGARYTDETKAATMDQFDFDTPDDKFILLQKFSKDFQDTTIAASLSYRWSDNAMTYLSYNEGFKSGGWNTRYVIPTADRLPLEFDQETAETIELGWKLDLFDGSLRLNGAFFKTDYNDLQFTFRVGPTPILFNAGKASIDGAELEFTLIPAANNNWLIEGGIGFLDASIDKVSPVVGASTSITTASELPYAPDFQGNIGISYNVRMVSGASLTPRIDFSYSDSVFFDTGNTVEIAQNDSVSILNASFRYEDNNGVWNIVAGVNNLTDEIYPIAGNSSLTTATGYAEIAYARGVEYFGRFTYEF